MKKTLLVTFSAFLVSACSSNQPKEQLIIEAAQACSQVCADHPNIEKVTSGAGAGIPLLFMGGMETSCQCSR